MNTAEGQKTSGVQWVNQCLTVQRWCAFPQLVHFVFIHCAAVPHQQMPLFILLITEGSTNFHPGTQDRFDGS